MGYSPVAVLAIIVIYGAFFAVISSAQTEDNPDLSDNPADTIETEGFGGLDILGDIIDAIIGVVVFIFDALTFNVTGAPTYIRVPVAVIITSSLIWSVVTLIRGN